MSGETWSDRLFGGFRKTSERLTENLAGIVSTTRLDDAQLDAIEDGLIAIVTDVGEAYPELPHFAPDDIAGIADFVLASSGLVAR